MRRVLLVAYHYPPEPTAGARRPNYLARYLPEFGWNVTVLTRPLDLRAPGPGHEQEPGTVEAPVIGARFERRAHAALSGPSTAPRNGDGGGSGSSIKRVLGRVRESLFFPDRAATWIPGAVVTGLRTTKHVRYDAIASTALPASAHLIGATIARLRGLPWLADYRDLWYGNPHAAQRSPMRSRIERALECRLLQQAAVVTTVSDALASRLGALLERPVRSIPNGYDPGEWSEQDATPAQFELCYTGSLYDGDRTPVLLFEALAALRTERDEAARTRVLFYGPNSDHVPELARRYGVEAIVEQRGVVPRPDALAAQRRASHLLIFQSSDPSTFDELGSKVFEYAGARRPVLAFGPRESALRPYVDRNALGWFASDLTEAKTALREAYRRFSDGDRELGAAAGTVLTARDLAHSFAVELDALL